MRWPFSYIAMVSHGPVVLALVSISCLYCHSCYALEDSVTLTAKAQKFATGSDEHAAFGDDVSQLKAPETEDSSYQRMKVTEGNGKHNQREDGSDELLERDLIRSTELGRAQKPPKVDRQRRDNRIASVDSSVDLNAIDNRSSEFGRVMERTIGLTSPNARSNLESLWKRLRSLLLTTSSSSPPHGGSSERADELTRALFQQLLKQFDLPAILRRRANKLRRRMGVSAPPSVSNSTDSEPAKVTDDGVRVVNFRKKSDDADVENGGTSANNKAIEAGSGDQQIRQWLGIVANEDQKLAQNEQVTVDRNMEATEMTSTTRKPSSVTSTERYPSMQLFQRRKGPVRVAVKVPQKHAKGGIKRFHPAQGREEFGEF